MTAVDLITPLSLWSLWVPLMLLMLIGVAAFWFVQLSQR
jgi:hypothetical protein